MSRILAGCHNGVYLIRFEGDVRLTLCAVADEYIGAMFADPDFKSVLVDLNCTEGIDSTSLGLLAKLSIKAKKEIGLTPCLVCNNPDILRILASMGFEDVFEIIDAVPVASALPGEIGELPALEVSQHDMQQTILESHRVLMTMNESNRELFKDLVESLEQEQPDSGDRRSA